jgi:repressor LexA
MLSKKQKDFLETLKEMVNKSGYFPTVREIGAEIGFSSPATVHAYLNRLYEKGYIKKNGRYWEVETQTTSVPLVGYVPAGSPHEIFDPLGEEIELPLWMIEKAGRDVMGFKVQGHSMKDAYIQDGDVVVVQKISSAEPGEMVVAILDDSSITLKRLKKDRKRFWLVPENPEYPPIYSSFQLVGKVVAVLRSYL